MKPVNSSRNGSLQQTTSSVTAADQNIQSIESSLTRKDIEILKARFPKERLGVKVQTFNRERTRAMLVLYLQHTDVQDRLEEVDPSWSSEGLSEQTINGSIYVRIRLTLKG